ncbi:10555_t:CDS:2 [Entrophospora sp. SA101]|nr:1923_t:CDS:2 [Entrophospora sp. SA101]CAJ0879116.1 10555_t:CDS:2 [Entrophospora sp. SA101]
MSPKLNNDVIRHIIINVIELSNFSYSKYNSGYLYNCIRVNRDWCRISMPFLWTQPFHFDEDRSIKIIKMFLRFLNGQEKQELLDHGMDIDLLIEEEGPMSFLFEYPRYIRSLNYESFVQTVIRLCIELSDKSSTFNYASEPNADIILAKIIMRLFIRSKAQLKHLALYDDLQNLEVDLEPYYSLVDPQVKPLFEGLKSLEMSFAARKNFLIKILKEVCTQVITSFISAQQKLLTFRLTKCKGYTRVFFTALSSHASTLQQIAFDQVDFKGCGSWEMLNHCNSLELLDICQCTNIEQEMVQTLINHLQPLKNQLLHNQNLKLFADNFQARYIGAKLCEELREWCRETNRIHRFNYLIEIKDELKGKRPIEEGSSLPFKAKLWRKRNVL